MKNNKMKPMYSVGDFAVIGWQTGSPRVGKIRKILSESDDWVDRSQVYDPLYLIEIGGQVQCWMEDFMREHTSNKYTLQKQLERGAEIANGTILENNPHNAWRKFDINDKQTWPDGDTSYSSSQSKCVLITDGNTIRIGRLDFDEMKFYIRNGNAWNDDIFPVEYDKFQILFGIQKQRYITHWMPLPEVPSE